MGEVHNLLDKFGKDETFRRLPEARALVQTAFQ